MIRARRSYTSGKIAARGLVTRARCSTGSKGPLRILDEGPLPASERTITMRMSEVNGTALTCNVRPAAVGDAEEMARIYREGIAERIATFQTKARGPAATAREIQSGALILVAE